MKNLIQRQLLALAVAVAPLAAIAQTTFFTDNFSNGSTTNGTSVRIGSPTASATSYDIASTKNTVANGATYTNNSIVVPVGVTVAPNLLHLSLAAGTTSGFMEAQALFATNGHPVTLSSLGDYINVTVVFTNTVGSLIAGGTQSYLWLGLFNSGNNAPVAGALAQSGLTTTAGSAYAAGNCANWQGYIGQISSSGTTRITTRPLQNAGGTTSANQELFGSNVGSGAFNNPSGTVIETAPVAALALTTGGTYTMQLTITLSGLNVLTISNNLYSGAGTGGTLVFSQGSTNVSGATYLTGVYDSLGIGLMNKGTSLDPVMDISSITVDGQSTAITTPPTITSQPVPVVVANGGSCVFNISAVGANVTYQWYRNNAALANGINISGVTSPQLVISPAGSGDVFSGANGYYCVVTGTGPYSTNSVTNSLALDTAHNLIWTAAGGGIWDLNNTVSWRDASSTAFAFNYGDNVTFDDTASLKVINLSGNYLSAGSITVNSSATYTFQGSGSIAGPGSLSYIGSGQLTLNNASTYSGGTLVSNAAAYVYLQNYNGLGTGPVTLAEAGGTIETTTAGGATLGFNGNINVLDDFLIKVDGNGTYATVFFGDLSGTAGKTLTINPAAGGTTNRFRAYGVNTTFNANLVIDDPNVTGDPAGGQALYYGTVLAPYEGSGSQSYNGFISGAGGIVQRGSGTTYLNNQNTYSGGTYPTAGTIGLGANSTPTSGTVTSGPLGTGPLFLAPEAGGTTASGTVLASGGARTIANPLQYPSGTNNLTLIIGGTNDLTFTSPFGLNGLDGVTSATYTSRFFQVANGGATTFGGVISDASSFYALTKTGAGALYLNAANTYTGVTTNSAGLLAGSGSVAGNVVVASTNASIGGGAAGGIGLFTINGNLTLTNGDGFFRLNRNGGSPLNDQVFVGGGLTNYGTGVITVTNLGVALQVGDTFHLFNKAVVGGATLTVSGGGAAWMNNLAVNGTIQVVPGVNTGRTNIIATVSGNTLALSWPPDHTGWRLQVQTNALATGLNPASNAWFTVSGSTNVYSTNITINPANGSVFYRLVYP